MLLKILSAALEQNPGDWNFVTDLETEALYKQLTVIEDGLKFIEQGMVGVTILFDDDEVHLALAAVKEWATKNVERLPTLTAMVKKLREAK